MLAALAVDIAMLASIQASLKQQDRLRAMPSADRFNIFFTGFVKAEATGSILPVNLRLIVSDPKYEQPWAIKPCP